MNPFVSRITHNSANSWIFSVSGICIVLGFMIAAAWVTNNNRTSRMAFVSADQRDRVNSSPEELKRRLAQLSQEVSQMSNEVVKLRQEKTSLENALANQTGTAKLLNESLQSTKTFAALTEVEGPGVKVTLMDSPKAAKARESGLLSDEGASIIHDIDVLRLVNELWASGAQAIAVNKHRLAPTSSIRCVGPVIHVDAVAVSSPIVIRAIGDPDTLMGGLGIPLGVLNEIRSQDPEMVRVERVQKMPLPAYTGSTSLDLLTVPKAKP